MSQSRIVTQPSSSSLSEIRGGELEPPESPGVPKLPEPSFDTSLSLDQIIGESNLGEIGSDPKTTEKVQKRASNVMKLAQENEKLKAELKAMTERLEAAEQRRLKLLAKEGGGNATSR